MTDLCQRHSGIEAELKAICVKMDLRFDAFDKDIDLAKKEMDRRLDGMNEFRSQLDRQAKDFIGRTELHLEIEKIVSRIVPIEKATNYGQGAKRWSDHILTVLIAAAVMFVAHFMLKIV